MMDLADNKNMKTTIINQLHILRKIEKNIEAIKGKLEDTKKDPNKTSRGKKYNI